LPTLLGRREVFRPNDAREGNIQVGCMQEKKETINLRCDDSETRASYGFPGTKSLGGPLDAGAESLPKCDADESSCQEIFT